MFFLFFSRCVAQNGLKVGATVISLGSNCGSEVSNQYFNGNLHVHANHQFSAQILVIIFVIPHKSQALSGATINLRGPF